MSWSASQQVDIRERYNTITEKQKRAISGAQVLWPHRQRCSSMRLKTWQLSGLGRTRTQSRRIQKESTRTSQDFESIGILVQHAITCIYQTTSIWTRNFLAMSAGAILLAACSVTSTMRTRVMTHVLSFTGERSHRVNWLSKMAS